MDKQMRYQIAAIVVFVLGLLLALTQVHSHGEAPETFRLSVDMSTHFVIGIILLLISAILQGISFFMAKKNTTET